MQNKPLLFETIKELDRLNLKSLPDVYYALQVIDKYISMEYRAVSSQCLMQPEADILKSFKDRLLSIPIPKRKNTPLYDAFLEHLQQIAQHKYKYAPHIDKYKEAILYITNQININNGETL